MKTMVSVAEAEKIISQSIPSWPEESCPLEHATGKVLREDVFADRDLPPGDKVLMDGIAVAHADWKKGTRQFKIEGIQAAGDSPVARSDAEGCLEIMTGAILGEGFDSVIPVERLKFSDGYAEVDPDIKLKPGQNVQAAASDHKKGDLLLRQGSVLTPPRIAVAASVGKSKLKVPRTPRVVVITTGDELVDVPETVEPYQIRKSNSCALVAALERRGYPGTETVHLKDNKAWIKDALARLLETHDILVSSGGVSMGKFDFIPEVLRELEVDVLFSKVRQKPGKPFWFGKTKTGKVVFALPGNPVSTQVGCSRYVLPFLDHLTARSPARTKGTLVEDLTVETDFAFFLPVRFKDPENARGQVVPKPVSHSGDFAGLAGTDGFLEIPEKTSRIRKGEEFSLYTW